MTDPTTTTTPQPTTAQLVTAFADALAPFAGPSGLLADTVMHAGLTFLTGLQGMRAAGQTNFTMADLEAAASKTTADLAQLQTDVAATGG
jgi:hypothetical protein